MDHLFMRGSQARGGLAGSLARYGETMIRSHPKTCFVARLSEKAVENSQVDAEGAREAAIARRRTEVRREPFSPTTSIHGLCSQS